MIYYNQLAVLSNAMYGKKNNNKKINLFLLYRWLYIYYNKNMLHCLNQL